MALLSAGFRDTRRPSRRQGCIAEPPLASPRTPSRRLGRDAVAPP